MCVCVYVCGWKGIDREVSTMATPPHGIDGRNGKPEIQIHREMKLFDLLQGMIENEMIRTYKSRVDAVGAKG